MRARARAAISAKVSRTSRRTIRTTSPRPYHQIPRRDPAPHDEFEELSLLGLIFFVLRTSALNWGGGRGGRHDPCTMHRAMSTGAAGKR
jgi:hypothetical protein